LWQGVIAKGNQGAGGKGNLKKIRSFNNVCGFTKKGGQRETAKGKGPFRALRAFSGETEKDKRT